MECRQCSKKVSLDGIPKMERKHYRFCTTKCAERFYNCRDLTKPLVNKSVLGQLEREHLALLSQATARFKTFILDENGSAFGELKRELTIQQKKIALVHAGFRCERCPSTTDLTHHHFILKRCKEYIGDFSRYLRIRYDWHNTAILCVTCHTNFHTSLEPEFEESLIPITQEFIDSVRRTYLEREVYKHVKA